MVSCAVVVWPLRLAEMVTWPTGALRAIVTVKKASSPSPEPEVWVTVTDAGTDATAGLLLDSATTTPLLFSGTISLSTISPPTQQPALGWVLAGDKVRLLTRDGASTKSWFEPMVCPLRVAVNETVVVLVTGWVVIPKVALVDPAGMVTVAGTEATAGSLLASVTTAPEAGAGMVTDTVPKAGVPPNVSAKLHVAQPVTSSRARVAADRLFTTSTVMVTPHGPRP